MPGDVSREWTIYAGSLVDVDLPTINPVLVTAHRPGVAVGVQRIVFSPNVYVAAVLSFFDSLTNVVIATLQVPAAEPALGDESDAIYVDFGPHGTLLSVGGSLNFSVTANGASGRLHVDAYQHGPFLPETKYVAPMTAGFTA